MAGVSSPNFYEKGADIRRLNALIKCRDKRILVLSNSVITNSRNPRNYVRYICEIDINVIYALNLSFVTL